MEYRKLGNSGLQVPILSLGTGTFGGTNEFFGRWGKTDGIEAARLIDLCLERGINFFDTANVYSQGDAETVLGKALEGKRDRAIIATKAGFQMGEHPNEKGTSRYHLMHALEDSLRRLNTDYIDLYLMHGFDRDTPVEETLRNLDQMVGSGKVRYIGCSNFTAWQLMKSLSMAEREHLEKYVVYQGYYSLIGRDYEQELMPLLEDQGLGLMAWSPLGWGRLTGKIKRGMEMKEGRIKSGGEVGAPPVAEARLYDVVDVLENIGREIEKTIPQVAINWVLQNKSVSNVVLGARNEEQLLSNLDAVGWNLSEDHMDQLDRVSRTAPIYPHWVGAR